MGDIWKVADGSVRKFLRQHLTQFAWRVVKYGLFKYGIKELLLKYSV
jgi:hypothetical protein